MSMDYERPVLRYTEEIIDRKCASKQGDCTDSEEVHNTDENHTKIPCHVSVDEQERMFIEIDKDMFVSNIHNKNSKELRKKDKIIAINGETIRDKTADDVKSLLSSCLTSEFGCSSMRFTLCVIRESEDQQSFEEITIRFVMSMTCDIENIHGSRTPGTYTRHITKIIKSDSSQKEVIIRAKSREEQKKYLIVEDGNLEMGTLSSDSRKKGVFTFNKWKVISRSEGGMEKARDAYTIQWNNLFLKGSAETGLRLEHAENEHGIPDDEALFRERNAYTKGTALESLLYMYYYIYYNIKTTKVSFYQKRPQETQYLGQTRRRAPDECRFKIIPASNFPVGVGFQEEEEKVSRRCFERRKKLSNK